MPAKESTDRYADLIEKALHKNMATSINKGLKMHTFLLKGAYCTLYYYE